MFWDNFYSLCKEKGTTPNAVAKALGYSPAICTHWKNGKKPSGQKLSELSTFFKVPIERLISDVPEPSNVTTPDGGTVHYRPVFNSVSAGFGAYADSDVVGFVPLIISNPYDVDNTICINVRGDSMYPKIEDGDTIVVRKQDTLQNGEIGVIRFGDEFFVKRVEFEKNALRLISINPEYAPRLIKGSDLDQAEIVGKVVKIVKDL